MDGQSLGRGSGGAGSVLGRRLWAGTRSNGFAMPLTKNVKKTPTRRMLPSAHGACSGWVSLSFTANTPAQMARMRAQSRIDPSSDDHRDTMVNASGVSLLPTSATYFTE